MCNITNNNVNACVLYIYTALKGVQLFFVVFFALVLIVTSDIAMQPMIIVMLLLCK